MTQLPAGVPQYEPVRVPRHLAIIMDGNRRWARQRRLPGAMGHRAGARNVRPVVQACAERAVARAVGEGWLAAEQIDEQVFAPFLSLGALPPPDLCVRTGGDRRISNFLLWDFAYTEFHFADVRWPDFDDAAPVQAVARGFDGVRVVGNPRRSAAAGLNLAVRAASHAVVVRCDARCTLPPGYIRRATRTPWPAGLAGAAPGTAWAGRKGWSTRYSSMSTGRTRCWPRAASTRPWSAIRTTS